jgi:hypothetical protein
LGITPYDKYKGHSKKLIEERRFHSDKKLSKEYVPLISGKSILRFLIANKVDEYLKYGDWLGASRERKFFTSPKIIVRQIVSGNPLRIYAGYSAEEYYFTQIGFSIISRPDSSADLKYLLALLNSSLINFFHNYKYLDIEKVVFQKILIANCKCFPIKLPQNQKPYITLVDKILEAKKENPQANTLKWEKQIDVMVYHLYNLTYDEAKIVDPELGEEEFEKYKL